MKGGRVEKLPLPHHYSNTPSSSDLEIGVDDAT
jgi:hypothetical protein